MTRNLTSVLFGVLALLLASCGGGNSPTPAPTPQPAQIAGNWTGNLESSNFASVAVNVQFTQAGDAVNGTWASTGVDWNGTITGTTTPTNFSGSFSISAPGNQGGRCTGTASVSGGASTSITTLAWTGPGFTGSCTGMPLNLRWNLQRR